MIKILSGRKLELFLQHKPQKRTSFLEKLSVLNKTYIQINLKQKNLNVCKI